jgi:hypothetical protein
MKEFTELLQFLYEAGAAVIPWLALALFALLTVKTWPHFIEWMKAKTEAQSDMATQAAEHNEILRNCNVVIGNCTETMTMIRDYMERNAYRATAEMERHEELSAERFGHMQQSIDRIGGDVAEIKSRAGIMLDRTRD